MTTQINLASPFLRAYSLNLTKDKTDAEDLYQETMYRIIKHHDKFEPGTNFKSWAIVVMRNVFINTYRKKSRQRTILTAPFDYSLKPANRMASNDGEEALYHQQLLDLVNALPESLSKPFLLMLEGFKYEEISETMGIPIGTIKSRIHLARKKLKQMYKHNYIIGV